VHGNHLFAFRLYQAAMGGLQKTEARMNKSPTLTELQGKTTQELGAIFRRATQTAVCSEASHAQREAAKRTASLARLCLTMKAP
jgi:hypothetical protein